MTNKKNLNPALCISAIREACAKRIETHARLVSLLRNHITTHKIARPQEQWSPQVKPKEIPKFLSNISLGSRKNSAKLRSNPHRNTGKREA